MDFMTNDTPTRMKQIDIARRHGVSGRRIRNLTAEGQLLRGDDGLYDVAQADELFSNFDADARAKGGKRAKSQDETPPEGDAIESAELSATSTLAEAKRQEAIEKALLARQRRQAAEGLLLERDLMESTLSSIGSTVQQRISNLAPKLRPHMSDAGREILDRELRGALVDMANDLERMISNEA